MGGTWSLFIASGICSSHFCYLSVWNRALRVLAGWKSWAGQRCFHVDLSQRCFRCVDKDRLSPTEFTDEVIIVLSCLLQASNVYETVLFSLQVQVIVRREWTNAWLLVFPFKHCFPFQQTISSIFEQCQLSSPELYCCLRHWQRKFDCAELSSDSGRCNQTLLDPFVICGFHLSALDKVPGKDCTSDARSSVPP